MVTRGTGEYRPRTEKPFYTQKPPKIAGLGILCCDQSLTASAYLSLYHLQKILRGRRANQTLLWPQARPSAPEELLKMASRKGKLQEHSNVRSTSGSVKDEMPLHVFCVLFLRCGEEGAVFCLVVNPILNELRNLAFLSRRSCGES